MIQNIINFYESYVSVSAKSHAGMIYDVDDFASCYVLACSPSAKIINLLCCALITGPGSAEILCSVLVRETFVVFAVSQLHSDSDPDPVTSYLFLF